MEITVVLGPSIIVYCAIIFLVIIISYAIYEFLCAKLRGDCFPESFPFQTSLDFFMSEAHNDWIMEKVQLMEEKFGIETCCFNMFGLPWLAVTNDVKNVTHILKNIKIYGKGPKWHSRMHHLFGNGIFSSDGDLWYKHRKTSSHLFNLNKFRTEMSVTFNQHCSILIECIQNKSSYLTPGISADSDEKGWGNAFDLQDLFLKFTLDAIGKIAFGKSFGALKKDRVLFAESFDFCNYQVNATFVDPLWLFRRYFTPSGWQYHYHIQRVNSFAYDLVLERRQAVAKEIETEGKVVSTDVLALYMDRSGDEGVSDAELRDVIMNFLLAGRDTTANALSWAFYHLCLHPDIQEKAYEEVRRVGAENNLDMPLSPSPRHEDSSGPADTGHEFPSGPADTGPEVPFACIQKMEYIEAFCMEVLRLYPSVPKIGKFVLQDDVLPDGTMVKEGMMVVFSPWVMGRTERFWDNCDQFRPERFLKNRKPSPYVFTAFQGGPRTCQGQNMALLEMKCVIARLLHNFEFKLEEDPTKVTYINTLVLPIKNGLQVSVKPRSSAGFREF
jgi:cytochrome P450